MQDSTSFSYSCISFSGSGEANHISVTSAVGLADDSMILDKMAKYQSKDLTTLFSKLGTLKHISNLLCGLFLHLYIFLISFLILPPCSHYLTVQRLSLIWPVFCSNPKLELSSRSKLECFKLWMCLSIWEVFSYVEVSYLFYPYQQILLSFIPKYKKKQGLGISTFCPPCMSSFIVYPMEPRIAALLGSRTHSLA